MDIDDIDVQVAAAMRSVAEAVRPPVDELVRGGLRRGAAQRHRRSQYGVALAGGVGLVAAAIITLGPGLNRAAAPATPAATSTATGPSDYYRCPSPKASAPLPAWASTGFSDPQAARVPYVLGTGGHIVAILFAQLVAGSDVAPKVLWVSRQDSAPLKPLEIQAQLDPAGPTVHRTVANGPGPSYLDLPRVGCWHLSLTWDGGKQSDTLNLRYVGRPTVGVGVAAVAEALCVSRGPRSALGTGA